MPRLKKDGITITVPSNLVKEKVANGYREVDENGAYKEHLEATGYPLSDEDVKIIKLLLTIDPAKDLVSDAVKALAANFGIEWVSKEETAPLVAKAMKEKVAHIEF